MLDKFYDINNLVKMLDKLFDMIPFFLFDKEIAYDIDNETSTLV